MSPQNMLYGYRLSDVTPLFLIKFYHLSSAETTLEKLIQPNFSELSSEVARLN